MSLRDRVLHYLAENEVASCCGEPPPFPHPRDVVEGPWQIPEPVPPHVLDFYFLDLGLEDGAMAQSNRGLVPFQPTRTDVWLRYHECPVY